MAMIGLGHIKTRLGQYGAAWVAAFLVAGAAILTGNLFDDLMVVIDRVLPVVMAAVVLALGIGVILTLLSRESLGTKLATGALALLLVLPLMWAPVAAAVAVAFFAERAIEYSQTYAAFQIGVSEMLFPLEETVRSGAVFGSVWALFQGVATVVGFISALSNIWPLLRRLLGPEPAPAA
ncbi:MAG: hypothetical protein Q8S03_14930 [Brevundimonas sp.]|uniref:hypothetical protein n=1 Tax=Brevundimonas sp. TaxID=1871086 RepID=UPI002736B438|nr:hypothetical protein [Brevundimonas sp.]MDP3405983.1 hypothetical protein [Brevundimonas sp.]